MIKFAEIINYGNSIRIVTQDSQTNQYSDPIEFEHQQQIETLEQLLETIQNYLNNGE